MCVVVQKHLREIPEKSMETFTVFLFSPILLIVMSLLFTSPQSPLMAYCIHHFLIQVLWDLYPLLFLV